MQMLELMPGVTGVTDIVLHAIIMYYMEQWLQFLLMYCIALNFGGAKCLWKTSVLTFYRNKFRGSRKSVGERHYNHKF